MWKLTENKIEETGKLYRSHDFNEEVFNGQPSTKFRLLDDDKEVYFVGLILDSALNGCEEEAFAPLDSPLGTGFGCTEMQYRKDGKWETL